LNAIVRLWPKTGETVDERLRIVLDERFDELDFLNQVNGVKRILRVRDAGVESVDVDFEDEEGFIHRARLVVKGDTIGLHWLKFECPACFGAGVNNDGICTLCDGAGWGAGR
jgi:hypothetical protein